MAITEDELRDYSANAQTWFESIPSGNLTASKVVLAREVCRAITRLDQIAAELQDAELIVAGAAHPLVTEQRRLGEATAKLIDSLRVPEDSRRGRRGPRRPRRAQLRGPAATSSERDVVARMVGRA
ncbi:hypothetical protein AB4Z55_20135 [Gordonia sp. ABKF26]|uniref:hypothetical protein n=1 Tax=Gordonia sp. ABKF26 TaxID=3238687 RepID=UPI0034E49D12